MGAVMSDLTTSRDDVEAGERVLRRRWRGSLLSACSERRRRAWPPVGAAHRGWRLVHRCERPALSGELTPDGDDDDNRAWLAAGLERLPASVQPAGASVRLCSHGERLARASALERDASTRRRAVVRAARLSARRLRRLL